MAQWQRISLVEQGMRRSLVRSGVWASPGNILVVALLLGLSSTTFCAILWNSALLSSEWASRVTDGGTLLHRLNDAQGHYLSPSSIFHPNYPTKWGLQLWTFHFVIYTLNVVYIFKKWWSIIYHYNTSGDRFNRSFQRCSPVLYYCILVSKRRSRESRQVRTIGAFKPTTLRIAVGNVKSMEIESKSWEVHSLTVLTWKLSLYVVYHGFQYMRKMLFSQPITMKQAQECTLSYSSSWTTTLTFSLSSRRRR